MVQEPEVYAGRAQNTKREGVDFKMVFVGGGYDLPEIEKYND